MLELPRRETSYWRRNADRRAAYPRARQNLRVDVAVVGGGLAGLNTAYQLMRAGLSVAVLEKSLIGSGTSGHTTGKVTTQHNLMYDDLASRQSLPTARVYANANQTAFNEVAELISREHIDCGWTPADNYVFTDDWKRLQDFKREAATAVKLGLPATYETKSPLPFKIRGAVKFADQAYMHAQKYMEGLAVIINAARGCHVFERTRAFGIHDGKDQCRVITGRATIRAKNVIIATNVPTPPLMARGGYCALEYPHKSYIVACRVPAEYRGMYISPDKGHYSILPVSTDGQPLVLIGGENHIPGTGRVRKHHQALADYAEEKLEATQVEYRWSARDYMAYDGLPLIGKLYPWSKRLYVATAFKKWGLTNTMVAAMLLRDLITDRENPWADTFRSNRSSAPRSFVRAARQELGF